MARQQAAQMGFYSRQSTEFPLVHRVQTNRFRIEHVLEAASPRLWDRPVKLILSLIYCPLNMSRFIRTPTYVSILVIKLLKNGA